MVPGVECLCRNGVLDGDVHRGRLALGLAVVHIEHVAIEGDVLIAAPFAGTVVDHDVAHRVSAEGILTVEHAGLTTAEAHVAHNHVVGIYLERLACNADAVAGSCLSGNGDIRSTHIDGRLQADDARNVEHHDAGAALFASPAE